MKYTVEVDIKAPLDRVMELFDNVDNLHEWQPGLKSWIHDSGEPGQPGAVSKMVYGMGKKDYHMTETIKVKNLPSEFTAIYEGPGMWNEARNEFIAIDENNSRWVAHHVFESDKLFYKVMMFFSPGAFKKQSLKFMNYFREFVEKQPATEADAD